MAITALAFVGKSLLGGSKDKGKQDPSQKATPKTPKVDGLKPRQKTPDGESLKGDKTTKSKPTTSTRVTRQSTSSPLLKKTGIVNIDSALQNVSKSLGSIKGTMAAQSQFNKAEDKKRADAARKKKRDKKEKESEKGPVGAVLGVISKVVPVKSIFGKIFKFFLNMVLGGLVFYFMDNFEKIMGEVGKIIDMIKDFFKFFNKWVVTPVFNMVKAIAGPVNTAIKALIPDIPDFDKENKDIESEFDLLGAAKDSFLGMIPGVKDAIQGIRNLIDHGDPSIGKEEFDQQVRDRQDQPPAPQATPPTEVPQQNPLRNQPGGVYTGDRQQATPPTDVSPSTPGGGGSGTVGTREQRALLDAVSFAEGTRKSYGTIFGGKVVPELENGDLTIDEVHTMMMTGMLRGRNVGYARGSAATGRYQFMPDTLRDVQREMNLPGSTKFTPQMQDKMILQRIASFRGVTPAVLAKEGLSTNVLDRLAPEFASFPYSPKGGRSYYDQPVKTPQSIRNAYQQSLGSQSTQQAQVAPSQRGPVGGGGLTDIVPLVNMEKIGGGTGSVGKTSGYGMRNHPLYGGQKMHRGIDIGTTGEKGWFVRLKLKGRVTGVGISGSLKSGYGKYVVITAGGLDYFFGHMETQEVRDGQEYNGEIIGEIGNTGGSSGEHLHFEVSPAGTGGYKQDIDPMPYVKYLEIGKRGSTPTGTRNVAKVTQPGARQRGTGIDRSASYDGSLTRTIIVPTAPRPQPVPVGGASGMMSHSGGRGRIDNNKLNALNKLYKQ